MVDQPEILASSIPFRRYHHIFVWMTETSELCSLLQAPEVSSIQLQGYNSTHLHPGSRLIIQFSNNTNLPSVAKASNLDNLFRVSPSTIASARQLAVWKDAATLLIVFQEDIHMPDTDLPMVHFTDPNGTLHLLIHVMK